VISLDQDAVVAAADLVDRTGARSLEIGWDCPHGPDMPDDHNCGRQTWYAKAQYKHAKIAAEHHPGPVEAAEALARRLLTGAKCRCGGLVSLVDEGAFVYPAARLMDGTRWSKQQLAEAGQCRWTRRGQRWEPGCNAPPIRMKGPR
jgi:hypothetical protein